MAGQFCMHKLEELSQPVRLHGTFLLIFCVLYFIFSFVAVLSNVLVILAMWKASSMPSNMKKLLLRLAFSDLALGMLAQFTNGVIMAVMLSMAAPAMKVTILRSQLSGYFKGSSFSSYLFFLANRF